MLTLGTCVATCYVLTNVISTRLPQQPLLTWHLNSPPNFFHHIIIYEIISFGSLVIVSLPCQHVSSFMAGMSHECNSE